MPTFWKSFFGSFFGKIASALFVAVCIAIGFGPDEWAAFLLTGFPKFFTPRIAQTLFLLLGIFTFICLTKNYIFSFFDALKNYIAKVFNGIEWIDEPHSIHSFGYVISRPHDLALVDHIQLKGKNTQKSSIIVKHAYLRSLVTGEKIEAEIDRLKAENLEIYSSSNFTILFSFPNEDGTLAKNSIRGISFQSFLKRFSNFEIIIETEQKDHRIEFNIKETKEWVSSVQTGLMMPTPGEKASVLKRS